MIITKIEIDNFGKYKNFTLDLNAGLNVILGRNEAGKSTLCAFLYAMFYGLPNESKKLGIREDARKRYLPWSGDAMSGTVYFEHDGRSYILSRKFAKTKRGDKVSLKDGTTWEEIDDISADDIGHRFLGLGEGGFLKTLFISQLGAAISPDGDDEVLKKLSNLGQSGAEDTSYQAASAAIFKAQHEIISKSERAGILPRLEQEKEQLEYELAESKRVSEKFKNDAILQNQLKQETEQLNENLSELKKQKELAKAHQRMLDAQKTKNELNILSERKSENDKRIEEQQKKLDECNKQFEQYKFTENISQSDLIALAQTENEFNSLKEELRDIDALKERLIVLKEQQQELINKQKPSINIKMLIIAAAISVLVIIFGVTLSLAYLILLPIGILFGVGSFIGRFGSKTKKEELVILEDECKKVSHKCIVATDDGSNGKKGFVTDVLKELIEEGNNYDLVIAIGPLVMMKFVSKLTKEYGIKTIVSMNPVMIDGTGMCGGCRVTVGGETKFACVDGPDFDGHLVDFDEAIMRSKTFNKQEQQAKEEHICKRFGGAL
ncbi:MAG: sulfide/dihydroorotate dehydrogenase-like FAD/NAD-binding protein [Clostridia bacterium]|nr:sulfide/dihydroorotate dehydrogenase-like FAD/NAD-binding protein [Clostridia bacterium]